MDLSSGYDDQPVIDTRAASAARLADQAHTDFDRHKNVYVGVHVPLKHRHQKKRSSKNGHHRSEKRDRKNEKDNVPTPPVTPPGQRVQFILGADDEAEKKEAPTIFTEMEELHMGDDMEMEWKECARWVKFEEDVEEGGDRWSKPHVATLSLHSLFELRSCILTGTVLLDMDANHLTDIANLVLDNMVHKGQLQEVDREKVLNALLSRHHHQTRRSKAAMFPMAPSLASLRRNFSNPNKLSEQGSESGNSFPRIASSASMRYENSFSTTPEEPGGTSTPPRINSTASFAKEHEPLNPPESPEKPKVSKHFMRKIPEGSEASNVLVGEVDFLKHPIIAFVRLSHGLLLGDLTEVPIPTRFLFFMLGPQGNQKQYHEVGRAIATLMSDEVFHNVAYKAKNRQDLLAGIDEFLDQVTVLPPGEWDPNIRIEPPSNIPSQEGRKYAGGQDNGDGDKEEEYDSKEELKRTGRFFGGLIDDVKRKAPHYLSDFKDGLNLQCLSSVLFLYFACITPVITFGGLLGDATDNYQAALENIFSAAICGTTYHLLAGQPLTIIGSTGPILVYETLMYNFCKGNGLEYLPFRVWVGLWTSFILLVMVATDASALVKYFTRFVEESFAALIALIFIVEAFKKLYHITDHYMVKKWWLESSCICVPPIEKNLTTPTSIMDIFLNDTNMTFPTPASMPLGYSLATSSPLNVTDTTPFNDYEVFPTSESDGIPWANLSQHDCLIVHHGRWVGENCDYAPDVFLMSVLLMFGTFFLASILKSMKTERFFPTMVRGVICDFAVFISVLVFVGVDAVFGVDTPKLLVPIEFKPTRPDRTWFINPVSGNPWWVGIAAVIPALLAVILIFMDQQITAVIVSRKEHKLKKGAGYHLDLFIVAILIGITSLLGLPWFVAATVLSLNHVNSLKMESDCSAPGEKPKFLGVRENRVTGLIVFLLIGLSVLFTSILRLVPMPVLYGVFLYMGFSSLGGIQMNTDLEELTQTVSKLTSLYTSAADSCSTTASQQGAAFLSQLPLEDHFAKEDAFMQQLTDYTKRQFFDGIADLAGHAEGSRYQFLDVRDPSSLLVTGETDQVIRKNCHELARLQNIFPLSQRQYIQAKVQESRTCAARQTMERKLQQLHSRPYPEDTAKLSKQLHETQAVLSAVQRESAVLSEGEVPRLIQANAELQATRILQGDYDLKIARQDYFISKQEEVISQLLKQRARNEFLLTALEVEGRAHRETRRLLMALRKDLEKAVTMTQDRLAILQDPAYKTSRTARATIDSRDNFTLRLHNMIVGTPNEDHDRKQPLFRTYASLEDGARSLNHELQTLQTGLQDSSTGKEDKLAQLETSVQDLGATVYDRAAPGSGPTTLGPKAILDSMLKLDLTLKDLEASLMETLKDMNKKKRELQNDPNLVKERHLFVDFFTAPDRLKDTIDDLNARVQAAQIS